MEKEFKSEKHGVDPDISGREGMERILDPSM